MAACALDRDAQDIGRGKHGPGTPSEYAARRIGHDMEREGRIGQRVDQAVVEHEARTVMAFFAGLEHELHGAGQLVAPGAQHFRRADQHRNMRVMPAGVHRTAYLRAVIQTSIFVQRQRIHVTAQQNRAAVGGAFQCRNQAGCGRPLAKLQRQTFKRGLDLGDCFWVLQAKLWLGMNGAPQFDKIGQEALGVVAPVGVV